MPKLERGPTEIRMTQAITVSSVAFETLRQLDTCSVSNAIERLNVRLRNEGFVSGAVDCRFPNLPPLLGYAVTGRIRTSSPPMRGSCYYDRMDWWNYLASMPEPRVMVIQDADHTPGLGALVGEIHATLARALNCLGCVTNGAVRDLNAVESLGFHLFSGSVSVSHAYAHIIDFGKPVEIGNLVIQPADLIHADRHGVHVIPIEIAEELPAVTRRILEEERELIRFCRSSNFSLQDLPEHLRVAEQRDSESRSLPIS
jgi:4-hydroxy-4-methyl-2-oxoglutarate aldolase